MSEHESKAHILAVATAVFAQKGFAKASMNDIVRASNLSKGGVYWHFKSKDAIVTAIFDQFFLGQLSLVDEVLSTEETAAAKLRRLASFTAEGVAALGAQFPSPLEFYALAAREETLLTHLRHHLQAYQNRLAALVAEGIAAGEFRATDAEQAAAAVISLFEGTLLLWSTLGEEDGGNLSSQINSGLDLLLAGLARLD